MSPPFGEEYFSRHILFHTHIAKSAGTSIFHALSHMLGPDRVVDRNKMRPPDEGMIALGGARKRSAKLLNGHFWYGTQERFFERRPIYLGSVREPIERFVSYYDYVLTKKRHPLLPEFDKRGPDRSARWYFLESPRLANEMSNSFGVPEGIAPIEWVEQRYAIVAPRARADSLIARLYELLAPDVPPQIWHSNSASAASPTLIRPDIVEECRAAAAKDILLCQQVEARYDEWLHDLEQRLQRTAPD